MRLQKPGRTTIIFLVGGLINILCLGYIVFGISQRSSLRSSVRNLSGEQRRLEQKLPDPSGMMSLSNQVRMLTERRDQLKRQMRFIFGESLPENRPDSPEVMIGDRTSKVLNQLQELYRKHNRSMPDDATGLPDEPNPDIFWNQLRQIYVAKHLHSLLLDTEVASIEGISVSSSPSEHNLKTRLNETDEMHLLTSPLTVTFSATLDKTLSVLHRLQTPDAYLQLLSLSIRKNDDGTAVDRDDPLLEVKFTAAPVHAGRDFPGETESTDTTRESEQSDNSSSLFN